MDRIAELREKILPILLPYGVKRIALFGSVARGEDRPDSDVDILVELKSPLGLKWFGLEEELSRALGRNVDLVSEQALSPYIRPYVERDLVILYEEDSKQGRTQVKRGVHRVHRPGSQRDDTVYLKHILDAVAQIEEYLRGVSAEQFFQERLLQDAVVRQLEIIGEASRNLSPQFRESHPEVPWGQIIGLRNRVIHGYFNVDLEAVWTIVQNDVPVLARQVQQMLN